MNQSDRRQLENQLMVMGLGGLNDPALVPQMAMMINMYGPRLGGHHKMFGDMLGSCEPEKRREMYDAIKPHLMFEVKPLDSYIAEVKGKAAAGESKSVPIVIGEQEFEECHEQEAGGVVVELTCYKCTAFDRFFGNSVVDATIMGRNSGWTRDLIRNKEVCPKCSELLVQ